MAGRRETYALGRRLGAGGLGVVYAAVGEHSQREVAVKFLHPARRDERTLRQFRDEALVGSVVRHANIASVIDDGADAREGPFLVMERAHGTPLGAWIARRGVLAVDEAVGLAREILAGIAALHDAGIVHADLKSDNVLVARGDAGLRVRLIDFGLAHAQFDRAPGLCPDEEQWLAGTPEYMAPEIVNGFGAGFASDLYAVGVILYEMLTGTPPFAGGLPSEIVARHVTDDVVPPSLRRQLDDVDPALDRLVVRALAKSPEQRFASARTFSAALGDLRVAHGPRRLHAASTSRHSTVRTTKTLRSA